MKKKIYWWNWWSLGALLVFLLVCVPVITILLNLFEPSGPMWGYVKETLVSLYLADTLILLVGVAILSLVLGVSMAWFVSAFNFPGRKYFEWLLILPLAFPSYMMAYSYVGIVEYTGPLSAFLRNVMDIHFTGPIIDVMNMKGAIMVLSFSLFPYVYVFARSSFTRRSKEFHEASLLLGKSPIYTFFKISLPMARPAIVGGLALVCMEALNDYGTVKYFGVHTLTTGIFRTWFSLGDLNTGVRLAAVLTILVFMFLALEHQQRGQKGWGSKSGQVKTPLRTQLSGVKKWLVFGACFLVLLMSFVFPLAQIIYWVNETASKVMNARFWELILNSFSLAISASLLIIILAIIMLYATRVNKLKWLNYVTAMAVLGYAIPGAVIALGIRVPVLALDKWFIANGFADNLLISSTVLILIFAYIVRFMAVGYQAIESGFAKSGPHVHEASRMLGAGPGKTLWRVDLPLVRNSIASGLLLVFVDIIKELPLTLILRPFNFHTLATRAFDLATNEQIAESANASLVVVLIGIIPVILLNGFIGNKKS